MDKHTISPAGDPFTAAPDDQDHPHACLNGYIYLGHAALDEETGEEVERIEALPCRRCAGEEGQASPRGGGLAPGLKC